MPGILGVAKANVTKGIDHAFVGQNPVGDHQVPQVCDKFTHRRSVAGVDIPASWKTNGNAVDLIIKYYREIVMAVQDDIESANTVADLRVIYQAVAPLVGQTGFLGMGHA